jgi:DNA-binding LacI/PurR family transcriptional regulator
MIDVHVMVPMDWAYTRQLLLGVRAYSREQSDWRLVIGCDSLSRINRNNAGLIAFVRSPALMAELCEAGIPAVNVSGRLAHSDVPRVMPDQEAIGTVAAEHLLERQHRSFVFVGEPGEFFCDERERGFRRTVERAGLLLLFWSR